MLSRLIESRPSVGIIASVSGFGASVLAALQQLSIVIGFLGAIFGLAAGYYAWRVKREHWKRIQRALAPAERVHKEALSAAKRVYVAAVEAIKDPEI